MNAILNDLVYKMTGCPTQFSLPYHIMNIGGLKMHICVVVKVGSDMVCVSKVWLYFGSYCWGPYHHGCHV